MLREGQLFEHFIVFEWYFFSPSFALPAPWFNPWFGPLILFPPSRHAVQRTLSHAQAEETAVQRKVTDRDKNRSATLCETLEKSRVQQKKALASLPAWHTMRRGQ